MARTLSRSNFRQWIADLVVAAQRDEARGWIAGEARYYELIGNVCWHFAPEEAGAWFQRALALRKRAGFEPSWLTISLLWKLRDADRLAAECRQAVAKGVESYRKLKQSGRPTKPTERREHERQLRAALEQVVVGHVFAREFDLSAEWAAQAMAFEQKWAAWDKVRCGDTSPEYVFVQKLSQAVLAHDREALTASLEQLRGVLGQWPTDAGDLASELYRFGLRLVEERDVRPV